MNKNKIQTIGRAPLIRKVIQEAERQLTDIVGCKASISISFKDRREANTVEMTKLKSYICDKFDVTWEQVIGRSRMRDIVNARYSFIYIAFTQLNLNKSQIGDICHRDHTTVIHALICVEQMYYRSDPVAKMIDDIMILTA